MSGFCDRFCEGSCFVGRQKVNDEPAGFVRPKADVQLPHLETSRAYVRVTQNAAPLRAQKHLLLFGLSFSVYFTTNKRRGTNYSCCY